MYRKKYVYDSPQLILYYNYFDGIRIEKKYKKKNCEMHLQHQTRNTAAYNIKNNVLHLATFSQKLFLKFGLLFSPV